MGSAGAGGVAGFVGSVGEGVVAAAGLVSAGFVAAGAATGFPAVTDDGSPGGSPGGACPNNKGAAAPPGLPLAVGETGAPGVAGGPAGVVDESAGLLDLALLKSSGFKVTG